MAEKKNRYNESTVATTKQELAKAVKEKYGTICIKGDLLKDMEKYFKLKTACGFLGISTLITLGAIFMTIGFTITLFSIPVLLISFFGSIGLTAGTAEIRKYHFRDDMGNKDDELYLVHNIVIKEIRSRYEGVNEGTAISMDSLNDMISKKVNVIYISKSYMDNLFNQLNSLPKITKKVSIQDMGKYHGYRISEFEDKYKFTRIR